MRYRSCTKDSAHVAFEPQTPASGNKIIMNPEFLISHHSKEAMVGSTLVGPDLAIWVRYGHHDTMRNRGASHVRATASATAMLTDAF